MWLGPDKTSPKSVSKRNLAISLDSTLQKRVQVVSSYENADGLILTSCHVAEPHASFFVPPAGYVCRHRTYIQVQRVSLYASDVIVMYLSLRVYEADVVNPGLEKSGRQVAICDQKTFLATRSQAAVVNLATNFSTKGPVWRPQFCARFHVRTNGTVGRPETNDRFPKTKFKISKTFLVIQITLTWVKWHTLTRPPAPSPPPPFEYGSSFYYFFWLFLEHIDHP